MIIDLKNNFDQDIYLKFSQLIGWIEGNENHRNAENYHNLHKKIKDFDCFEVLLNEKKEIIAFSGLYNNGYYPGNIARACTRTYYTKNYRDKSLKRSNRWVEDYLINYEIETAKQLKYDYIFISIKEYKLRRSLQHLNERLKTTTGYNWTIYPKMCNTCRQHNDNGKFIGINNSVHCWQNISYIKLNDHAKDFPLPTLEMQEYKEKFI